MLGFDKQELGGRHLAEQSSELAPGMPIKKRRPGVFSEFVSLPSTHPAKKPYIMEEGGSSSGFDQKLSSAADLGKISNLDLNISLGTWDSDDFPLEHERPSRFCHGAMLKQVVETGPVQPSSEFSGTQLKGYSNLKMPGRASPSDEHNSSEVTLDLQLKPPTRPELRLKWGAPAPDLCLSLTVSQTNEPSRVVTNVPIEEIHQKGAAENLPSIQTSPYPKLVKFEPCGTSIQDGASKAADSKEQELTPGRTVKKEPSAWPSQDHLERLPENAPHPGDNSGSMTNYPVIEKSSSLPESLPIRNAASNLDLNFEVCAENNTPHGGPETPTDVNTTTTAIIVAGVLDSVPVPVVSDSNIAHAVKEEVMLDLNSEMCAENNMPHDGPEMSTDVNTTPAIITAVVLDPVPESVIPDGNIARTVKEEVTRSCNALGEGAADKDLSAVLDPVAESVIPESNIARTVKEVTSSCNALGEGTPNKDLDMTLKVPSSVGEACAPSRLHASLHPESVVCEGQDPVVFDGMSQGSAEMDFSDDDTTNRLESAKLNEGSFENWEQCTDNQQESCSSSSGSDSRVKVPSQGHEEGECNDGKVKDAAAIGSKEQERYVLDANISEKIYPENTPIRMPQDAILKNIQPVQASGHRSGDCDGDLYNGKNDVGCSSTDLCRSSVAGDMSASVKTKLINHPHRNMGDLVKYMSPGTKTKSDRSPTAASGSADGNCNDNDPSMPRRPLLSSANNSMGNGVASRRANGCGIRSQIKTSNSVSVRSSGRTKFDPARTFCMRGEMERLPNDFSWEDASDIRANRNARWEEFVRSDKNKNEDHLIGRHKTTTPSQRRPPNWYGGRNSNHHGISECSNSKSFRFRGRNDSEALLVDAPDGKRLQMMENEQEARQSLPLHRRRSPVPMEELAAMGRDLPESHCRDLPESFVLADEENLRPFPDEMVEPPIFRQRSRFQYERTDHVLIRRERSLSPPLRRGAPLHLVRARSPQQWSPPMSPDTLRCRSPPLRRSPRRRPCFPEGMMVRRHVPFDDPRAVQIFGDRGLQRNSRRYEPVNPQEAMDGENFGHLIYTQEPEIEGEAEPFDRRRFEERREFVRSFGQLPYDLSEADEIHPYPVEDGPHEEFSDEGGPRELEGRHRNHRVGSAMSRLRGIGRQDDRCRGGPQKWRNRNSNNNNARPKRRY